MAKKKNLEKSSSLVEFFRDRKLHLIVFAFSFLLYANTIPNQYNLDDELVTSIRAKKPHRLTSQGIAAIPKIFSEPYYSDQMSYAYDYRPIVLATFAIEYSLFGANPVYFTGMGIEDSARFYLHRAELMAPGHPDVINLKNALDLRGQGK